MMGTSVEDIQAWHVQLLEVSRKAPEVFSPAKPNERLKRPVHVLAVDCGIKNNIIRPNAVDSGSHRAS